MDFRGDKVRSYLFTLSGCSRRWFIAFDCFSPNESNGFRVEIWLRKLRHADCEFGLSFRERHRKVLRQVQETLNAR